MDCRINIIGLVWLMGVVYSSSDFIGKNSIGKRHEYLDREGKYLVEWEAYSDTRTIVFELTVATTGHIGFGISPVGGMMGADIIIGGVHPNGTVYFSNRHGVGNQMPEVDDNETWKFLGASENVTHTYLKVGRQWNTCDPQDVAIGSSTNNFIWSIGAEDVISYHGTRRGTMANMILDPPMPPMDTTKFKSWKMVHTIEMPSKVTTYWCTVQKSPTLSTKHHVVGFRAVMQTPEALTYGHHIIAHKCRAPNGYTDEEYFEHFVNQPGDECYEGTKNTPSMSLCESSSFLWAIGGQTVLYPEHVGYPLGVDSKPTYYLLEVHYNNPGVARNVIVETGLEILYTKQLRQYDAGTIGINRETSWALTIPPKSNAFMLTGQCSPSCTKNIPENGINVFSALVHAHLAGRKMRIRHFRDGSELPWIINDENYSFDFQLNRPLLKEAKILPGDQLIVECTYDTMDRNETVIGGLSTTDEMCRSYILYYPENEIFTCSSDFPKWEFGKKFGIESTTRGLFNPTVEAPESMAKKTYTEVLDTMVQWSKEFREKFQHETRYDKQTAFCGLAGRTAAVMKEPITYPIFSNEYVPVDECAIRHASGTGNTQNVGQLSFNFLACILVACIVKTLLI